MKKKQQKEIYDLIEVCEPFKKNFFELLDLIGSNLDNKQGVAAILTHLSIAIKTLKDIEPELRYRFHLFLLQEEFEKGSNGQPDKDNSNH